MSSSVRHRTDCRLCGSGRVEPVLRLTPTPPANAFIPAERIGEVQEVFPLDVHFCGACGHVQLLDVVDPAVLFRDYVYVSGTSPAFVKHFERYADFAVAEFGLAAGDLVVDVGSNDGTLLRFFKAHGCRVLGIDPARDIARRATEDGIETLCDFFTGELAAEIRRTRGPARLVTANNVFAHADDLSGIVRGVSHLLSDDGAFVFEVSYLLDVVQKTLFDTIYHEHLSYHSVAPLVSFFERHGMVLTDVLRMDTHGGSIRGVARPAAGGHAVGDSVRRLVAEEQAAGLLDAETFRRFDRSILDLKEQLTALLGRMKAEGKSIAAYGAPAKATTLMYHFGLGPDIIDFIVDDSPLKQGLFSPGLHIPVLPSSAIEQRRPGYMVILAWNFAPQIIEKCNSYLAAGGHLVCPLPELSVT